MHAVPPKHLIHRLRPWSTGALCSAALLIFSAVWIDAAAETVKSGQRIFIAGHSFNVFICAPLEALAREAGIQGHTTYGVQFIGNSTPMQHWNQGTDETNLAKRALRTGELDVFTLSPNATMPEEAIDKFADLAQQTNPKIRLLVQASWAAWDGNEANLGSLPPRPEGARRAPPNADAPAAFPMGCPPARTRPQGAASRAPGTPVAGAPPAQSAGFVNADRDKATAEDIEAGRERGRAYMERMRAQLHAINSRHDREMAFIVPAGEAVARLRELVVAGTLSGVSKQSELFADAMGHAGPVLSDLVSYVWFAALYGRNPLGLTALDEERSAASKEQHRVLQQLAWDAVRDEPMSGVK